MSNDGEYLIIIQELKNQVAAQAQQLEKLKAELEKLKVRVSDEVGGQIWLGLQTDAAIRKLKDEIASLLSCSTQREVEYSNTLKAAEARADAAEQEVVRLRAEGKCDKCERMVPSKYLALEIQDGAPLSNADGSAQQWCIVCHSQRVIADLRARADAAEQELKELKNLFTGDSPGPNEWEQIISSINDEEEG